MDLRLFDTASGEVKKLAQREPGRVSMYVCGPTVYDLPHIGHGRYALVYDVLRRYIESRGVEVEHISNITDIDDKIINKANDTGVSTDEVVERYEHEWYSALARLNILRPHKDPHATAYVDEMIELITKLIEAGFAYETSDTVYFSPEKVPGYGLLARQSVESLRGGARVEAGEEKRSPIDFALWKKAKPGEPSWKSPWGPGRPGWHTECVVMSLDLLGDGFDIHGGGLDLAFPHHENERAQATALGNTFARHWMHNGFVEMGGEKMSKSLGNFTTLTDLLDRTDPRAYRMLTLRAHYRSPIEVTETTIADAEAAVARLDDFARRFAAVTEGEPSEKDLESFNQHMDNDLDTPKAMAELFNLVREANAEADDGNTHDASMKAAIVLKMANVFGLELASSAVEIDAETEQLISQRDEARSSKQWAEADRLRDELQALGWTVEDTQGGTRVYR